MKLSVIVLFLGITASSFGQNDEFMVWSKAGVRGDIVKNLNWMFELNGRFDDAGLATLFPQAGVEYKVAKWIKPSLEYRFLIDKNKYGNFKSSHRLNANVNFKGKIERFSLGARVRYQYAFEQFGAPQSYDSDFDQAIRLKPSISYNIRKSMFSPAASAEFFYNPVIGFEGRQFTKMRIAVGTKIEPKGPHSFAVKYQVDKKFHNYEDGLRHIVAFSYEYKL